MESYLPDKLSKLRGTTGLRVFQFLKAANPEPERLTAMLKINWWMVGWLVGWLVGGVVGWVVGSLVGWLVGWVGSWLVGWVGG